MKFFENKALVLAIMITIILITIETPPWIGLSAILILLWKWFIEKKNLPNVSRFWTSLLAILLLVLIAFQYRSVLGQEPSTSLLLGLLSLRIMDYQSRRDHLFVVLLGFILLSAKFLFSLDIYWILPGFVAFTAYWFSLMSPSIAKPHWFLSKIFLVSLPITILLFLVFPRLSLPWAAKSTSLKAISGFSDQLNPGEVTDLSNSNELVFRVQFKDDLRPKLNQLYWRGVTLSQSNGLSWKTIVQTGNRWYRPINDPLFTYEIVLEPQDHNYLFTLDLPVKIYAESTEIMSQEGRIFKVVNPQQKRFNYSGASLPHITENERDLTFYLQKTQVEADITKLVNDLKKQSNRIEALDDFFKNGEFFYTKQPGSYDPTNGLSEFLLKRKKGFCEHYAGAYATLARHLDIPARVINGYHGGEYNSYGDFFKVTQRDAHSWAEVYDTEKGKWVRKDPTYWIAPLRIELGAEQFFNLPEEFQVASFKGDLNEIRKKFEKDWSDKISFWTESVNYKWNQFLLDFDSTRQSALLESLPISIGWFIFISIFIILFAQYLLRLSKHTEKRKPSRRLMELLIQQAEKKGIKKEPSETPLSFLKKIRHLMSVEKKESIILLEEISTIYDQCAYQNKSEVEPKAKILLKKVRFLF